MELAKMLDSTEFTQKAARAALRGQSLPGGLARQVLRLCVIRGIRYHSAFAEGPAKILRGVRPEFTRALNARAIMSNRIPDMDPARPEELPYCIWHPDVASEDTYRQLVQRYPSMAYQVGRACAVAGYTTLYLELDILPEVSIAEEARANGHMAIFDAVMAEPVKHRVMDDYRRLVNHPGQHPAHLNGDTAVRPMLDAKQAFSTPDGPNDPHDLSDDAQALGLWGDIGFKKQLFNITEDMNIDEEDLPAFFHSDPTPPWADSMTHLLTEPLPIDLPGGNKDLLILLAAYNGDIDRYARLRRPIPLPQEPFCLVRGIYHHPMFGVWFARTAQLERIPHPRHQDEIAAACHARRIMCNDLSSLPELDPAALRDRRPTSGESRQLRRLPYLIWYPALARPTTYRELARRLPVMRAAVLRAAVFGNMQDVFDELLAADPALCADGFTLKEAEQSANAHYAEAILARAAELKVDISFKATVQKAAGVDDWKWLSLRAGASPSGYPTSSNMLDKTVSHEDVHGGRENIVNIYNGAGADASRVELFAGLPPQWIPNDDKFADMLDYENWPDTI